MTEEKLRAGELCADCGTPLELADASDDPDASESTLVLRCPNGHVREVHRHREEEPTDDGGEL